MKIKNKEYIKYTWNHKKAFLKIEKQLLGKISLRGILHDADKLFLYLMFSKETTTKIHRKISRHHLNKNRKITRKDCLEAIIDWECARYTKPDKPLNARDTLYAYKRDFIDIIEPILNELNL